MHEQEWQGADSDHESSNESDGDANSSSSGSSSLESDELDDGTSESDEGTPCGTGSRL